MPSTRTQLPRRALDVLRAFAVLCVLGDHLIVSQAGETTVLWALGRLGVLIFFVHTSLVLMSSLERHEDGAARFYIRRAFRIYPLAIVTVVAAVAFGLPTSVNAGHGTAASVTPVMVIANLTLTQNLLGAQNAVGPLWSLPLEVQMYALLPVCFLVARRGPRAVVRLIGIAIALWLIQRTNSHLWRANILAFGPVFLLGVLAYAWLGTNRLPDLAPSWITRMAAVIAEYSYGIYLLHIPALGIAFVWGRQWPAIVQWSVFAVLLVALPFVAYHGIEQPSIALGKRVAARMPDRRAVAVELS
jgi:peptidoglycan/LPS O-acetylase OafA/YrhL